MKKLIFVVTLSLATGTALCQTDTLQRKLDSLSRKPDSAQNQVNNTAPGAYNQYTEITFSSFFALQWSNLKQSFTKPFHMSGRNWRALGTFALVTGALAFADEPLQRWALNVRERNAGLRTISGQITRFGGGYEGYTLGALGAYGFLFKNEKMQTTTLLALQSYITGAAVQSVVKFVTGRQRPFAYNPRQVDAEPTFLGPFKTIKDIKGNKLNGSFPSGHTTVAFAAATVYALEYRQWKWVPWVSYTAASLIGLSRITENKHWLTDVVAGAALGYLSGKQVVNNYHRYAKIKSPRSGQPLRKSVSFSMGLNNGQLLPAMVYRF